VPWLDARDNTSGQPIDGLGDVSAGFKVALLADCETGSTLSAGLTVTTPTGRDSLFINSVQIPPAPNPLTFTVTTVNPTYVQPWVGGLLVLDRFFVQEYFGVIVPTEDNDLVATFLNNNVTVGFQLYRSSCGGTLRSVTPTLDVQALIPVSDRGSGAPPVATPGNPVATQAGFRDQVFVTPGVTAGLGDILHLATGIVVPVVGPRAFDIGVTVGVSFLF